MNKFKVGDRVIVLDGQYAGEVGTVLEDCDVPFVKLDIGPSQWAFPDDNLEHDLAFTEEDQRQPDPYTGPTPPEAPEYVYKGVKAHDLVLTIPEGTKRLEGEFEGYKVILEKL